PRKPPSPDRACNAALPAAHGDAQSGISELAKQADARSSFNELLDTPIDFSNFIMHRLNVDTLTPDLLAGPTYELMKGSCSSLTELEYHLEEQPIDYNKHALWGVSHWGRKRKQFYGYAVNRESARDVYSKRRIIAITELQIMEWHDYKHLDWISYQKEVNEICAETITKNANPLALVAAAQTYLDPYYQAPKSHKAYAPPFKQSSSTRSNASIKYKGKEIAKPITPPFESASKEDSDPEQAQRDIDM
nr:hypothetical protein [Tanacetum cinerariifolium]